MCLKIIFWWNFGFNCNLFNFEIDEFVYENSFDFPCRLIIFKTFLNKIQFSSPWCKTTAAAATTNLMWMNLRYTLCTYMTAALIFRCSTIATQIASVILNQLNLTYVYKLYKYKLRQLICYFLLVISTAIFLNWIIWECQVQFDKTIFYWFFEVKEYVESFIQIRWKNSHYTYFTFVLVKN